MAAEAILVVAVVADPGPRSALAAHLSLDGRELLTASGIGYGLLGSPMIREPAVLMIDEALIPGDAERWIEKQRNMGGWRHLVVLADTPSLPVNGADWLIRVSQRNTRKMISELLTGWARDLSRDR